MRAILGLIVVIALAVAAWRLVPGPSASAPSEEASEPRLVSLSPQVTETIVAIGALDQLVGRSAWDHGSPALERIPPAGSALTPDLETIARLRPTRILVESTAAGPVVELRAIAPVEALPWLDVDEAAASIRKLGKITGHEAQADAEAARLTSTFANQPDDDAPRVLLALGADDIAKGELWYVKRNSLHGRALEAAGFRNAVDHDVTGEPMLTGEELIRLDPDAILVLVPGEVTPEQREAIVRSFDELRALSAVKRGAVAVVDGDTVMDTGPGIVALVAQLHQAGTEAVGAAAK